MNEIESNLNLGCAVVSAGEKKVTWRARAGITRSNSAVVLRDFSLFLFPSTCKNTKILLVQRRRDKRKENKKERDLFRLGFRVERRELFCFVSYRGCFTGTSQLCAMLDGMAWHTPGVYCGGGGWNSENL